MDLVISNVGNRPIYEQIYSQIKQQIVTGKLTDGEPLPSIRALAKDLRISVITTKRAYEDLERDGYICMIPGKGCYVNGRAVEKAMNELMTDINVYLNAAVCRALDAGIELGELKDAVADIWRAKANERD